MILNIEKFVGSKLLVSWSLDEEENKTLYAASNPHVIISTSSTVGFDASKDMKSERRFSFPLRNGKGYISFSGSGEHIINYAFFFNEPSLWDYQYYSSYAGYTVFAERLEVYSKLEDSNSITTYIPDYIFASKSAPNWFDEWKSLYLTSSLIKEDTRCESWFKTLFAVIFQPFIFTLDLLARLFLFYLSFLLFMDGFLKLNYFNVNKFSLADAAFNLFEKRLFCEKPSVIFGYDPGISVFIIL